jgi:hypothetical protein
MMGRLKNWWRREPPPAAVVVPFAVTCACGQKLTGVRQAGPQVVRCPRCAAERFILPRCPFALTAGASPAPSVSAKRSLLARYAAPLLAIGISVTVLVVLIVQHVTEDHEGEPGPGQADAVKGLVRAHDHMKAGNFRLAAEAFAEFTPALTELPQSDRRRWSQLAREASLLADLSSEGLEEILRHAARTAEGEWQADFRHRHHGKAILFDATVQRHGKGYRLSYAFEMPGEEVHLELGDVALFKTLELEQPRRLILGLRLAGVAREAPGPRWGIRFLPDSGVLLTDPDAAAWACPAWSDAESRKVLEEQRKAVE